MNKLGIPSLNAGAPDLRLSGDQTQRGTYTQRRRNQMAYGGIAGLDGRKAYGIGSWFQKAKDKFVDDIIPNELKSPTGAALFGGALLNQFGIPFTGQFTQSGKDWGQNWLGNLLSAIPGTPTGINTVIGDKIPFLGEALDRGLTTADDYGFGITGDQGVWYPGIGNLAPEAFAKELGLSTGTDLATRLKNAFLGSGQTTGNQALDEKGNPIVRWKEPLAIGSAIGAADYLTRSDDKMPEQLSIDPSRFATAAAAKADPNLRFKPQEQYTLKDGGRIGFTGGGEAEDEFSIFSPSTWFSGEDETQDVSVFGEPETIQHGGKTYIMPAQVFPSRGTQNLQGDALQNYIEKNEDMKLMYRNNPDMMPSDWIIEEKAQGGRIGYATGGDYITKKPRDMDMNWGDADTGVYTAKERFFEKNPLAAKKFMQLDAEHEQDVAEYEGAALFDKAAMMAEELDVDFMQALQMIREGREYSTPIGAAQGGRIGAQEGGLMNLGGMEKDYRQEGGFVPIGGQEKADDVPARLSKNEFVFTADAVRSAGGGDIDEGAAVMERLMENLEAGGKVSEDSQGLEGAQEMFANTQRLQNRII